LNARTFNKLVKTTTSNEELEKKFRVLYWQKNECQICLPDIAEENQAYAQELIQKMEDEMNELIAKLGYTPAA
jgi:hypothetical protein